MKASLINSSEGIAEHNDRQFDVTKAPHINRSRMKYNIYHNIYDDPNLTFEQAEKKYYKEHYSERLKSMNESARKARHPEKIKSMDQYMAMDRYKPKEIIIQIGNQYDNIDSDMFKDCVNDFISDFEEKYSSNCHILDYAIHNDEATPHAHIRLAWDYTNDRGELDVSRKKALAEMGFRGNKDMPINKYNNGNKDFTKILRENWIKIAEDHGFEIEKEPDHTHTEHLSVREYKAIKNIEKDEQIRQLGEISKEQRTEIEEKNRELEKATKQMEEQNALNQQRIAELEAQVAELELENARYKEEKEREEREERETEQCESCGSIR